MHALIYRDGVFPSMASWRQCEETTNTQRFEENMINGDRQGLPARAIGSRQGAPGQCARAPPHHKAPRRAAHRHANSPQVVGNTALALRTFVIEAAAPQTVRDVVVPISEPVTIMNCASRCAVGRSAIRPSLTFVSAAPRNCRAKD